MMHGGPARGHTMPIGPATVILLYCRYEIKEGVEMHWNHGNKLYGLRLCNYGTVE